jgi:hypothetical protein
MLTTTSAVRPSLRLAPASVAGAGGVGVVPSTLPPLEHALMRQATRIHSPNRLKRFVLPRVAIIVLSYLWKPFVTQLVVGTSPVAAGFTRI